LRFLADGPDIPDELLIARDQGRVVFFCGAGVSQARAQLPNFYGLAERVLNALEGNVDSASKQLIEAARKLEKETKVGGLVSADRVFSILQSDFEIRDVEAAVAKALEPAAGVDLSAHQTMLDLARGPDGRTRLVTTNFELLFEKGNPALKYYRPGQLPDLQRNEELDGIVHLHGIVKPDYSGAEGGGFILSSAEFGGAYIAHGWATRFISSILKKYLVVFVGYTADDPPVQYLLEALNRDPGSSSGLYAFQSGLHTEAEVRWLRKGVQPITYDERDRHKVLWESLEAWADRARNVDRWYDSVIATAMKGPAELLPHERGQVKHIVSTLDGARRFGAGETPPPAEWLCVFERATRFAPPGRVYSDVDEKTVVDPFAAYGLDADPVPPKGDPDDPIPTRKALPAEAWDCFDLTRLDGEGLSPGYLASLTGSSAMFARPLVPRLAALGTWLSKVCEQPAAVWWAAGRGGLHPDVRFQIRIQLDREKTKSTPQIRTAWRLLLEAGESSPDGTRRDWFELRASLKLDGWSPGALRQFVQVQAPNLKITRPIFHGPRPPLAADDFQLSDLISLDVEYPHLDATPQIPDDYLRQMIRLWRALLERAVLLERDTGPYSLDHFCSLAPEEQGQAPPHHHGLSIPILYYRDLFKRLLALNTAAAREEVDAWWSDDDTVFARLKIWASGEEQLCSPADAVRMLSELSDRAFWALGHQRDLLVVLGRRWKEFEAEGRAQITNRLLAGPPRHEKEEAAPFAERRAWSILMRLQWLRQQGCAFDIDVEKESASLKAAAPDWQAEFAANAAESRGGRVSSVHTDSTFDALLGIPRKDILPRARELSAQRQHHDDQKDPFAGLASARPVLALSAITLADEEAPDAEWAWRTFLNVESRKNREGKGKDDPKNRQLKFSKLIAGRLSNLALPQLVKLLHPVTDWLLTAGERYPAEMQHFESLWTTVIMAVREAAKDAAPVARRREPEWATEALNSPAGKLAQAMMTDPTKADGTPGSGFDANWLKRVEQLIDAPGNTRRHALAIFAYNLNWFYARDPAWAEEHILSALKDREDAQALWAGVLWSGHLPQTALYLRLKPALLKLERESWITRHNHLEVLAAMLLAGWGSVDAGGAKLICNDEMRTLLVNASDEFRSQVLWQIEKWSDDPVWIARIRPFLTDAWPRQKTVKTPKTSARLAELAFSNEPVFADAADLIIDLVTTVERDHLMLFEFIEKPDAIIGKHPEKSLALLAAVLPVDVRVWPYRIEQVLDRIGSASPALQTDARLLELRRRWNTR
jgi:hypothetical protein